MAAVICYWINPTWPEYKDVFLYDDISCPEFSTQIMQPEFILAQTSMTDIQSHELTQHAVFLLAAAFAGRCVLNLFINR